MFRGRFLIGFWFNSVGRYVCLAFYRRGNHVAEMQVGKTTTRADEACSPTHFDPASIPFVTLVSEYSENL